MTIVLFCNPEKSSLLNFIGNNELDLRVYLFYYRSAILNRAAPFWLGDGLPGYGK